VEFFLQSPLDHTEYIGKLTIKNMAIASSSNYYRHWKNQLTTENFGHLILKEKLIKPKLGTYTLAKTATIADVGSTSLFVCQNELEEEIAKNLNLEYLIVYQDQGYQKSKNYPVILNTQEEEFNKF
jgi:thiamine biosynthesis lipoprotein ApbE